MTIYGKYLNPISHQKASVIFTDIEPTQQVGFFFLYNLFFPQHLMVETHSKELGWRCAEPCGHCIYPLVLGEIDLGKDCRFAGLNRSYTFSYLKQTVVL